MPTHIRDVVALAQEIAARNVAPNVVREFVPFATVPTLLVSGGDELNLTVNGRTVRALLFDDWPMSTKADREDAADKVFDWLWRETKQALVLAGHVPYKQAVDRWVSEQCSTS